ncbi:hypothetical protein BKA57DRAFT_298025 [Linnemannia elongata]|nr:hypothetical protein BKA57DRAFT_298025 [Linnemannia elongata]
MFPTLPKRAINFFSFFWINHRMWTSNGSQHSATIPPTQQQKIDTRVWTLGSRSAPTSCASTTLSRFSGQNNNEQKTTLTAPAAPASVPRGSSLVGEGKPLGPPHSFFFFYFFFFFFFFFFWPFFLFFFFFFFPPSPPIACSANFRLFYISPNTILLISIWRPCTSNR